LNTNSLYKNLITIAVLTSFILGVLINMPLYMRGSFPVDVFLKSTAFAISILLINWSINILLVYLSEKKTVKKFGNGLRYLFSYLINVSFTVIIFVFFKTFLLLEPQSIPAEIHKTVYDPVFSPIILCVFLNSIILIIQEVILLKNKKNQIELENAQLRVKNTEAYYRQLKQQIHPHFLFNSLNILKTLIRKDPDTAEDYLVKLSDFLRVSISSTDANTVKLADELKLCHDFLDMQKVRFGKSLEYTINISEEIKNQGCVPVFSIQLLLENAIKHNSLTVDSPLKINIVSHNGVITVSNNIHPKSTHEETTGLGLANLSERYKILSGNDILIISDEKHFSVSIKILPQ